MKKIKKIMSLFVLLFCCTNSCKLSAGENAPYILNGEMVIENSPDYEIAGINFFVMNKSDLKIKKMTIVFYLFDEDGNPPPGKRNSYVIDIETDILPKESYSFCLNIDQYLYVVPEQPYLVDYLYLSRIEYEDGSVWSDPFGMKLY